MLNSLLKGVTSTVKASLEESLVQILSPRRRIDILRDAMDAKKRGKPFSITFCGVNGVGKSTNLAKVKHGAHCEETCPISLSSGWKRLEITSHAPDVGGKTCITLSTLLTLAVFRTRFTEKRIDGLAHRKVSVPQW